MTIRAVAQCVSCDSKIITRTQVGHKDSQTHTFPCPTCGVLITYILDLDQKNAGAEFRGAPKNANWVDSEEGAVKILSFSDEIPIPMGVPSFVSPSIATFGRYDWKAYQYDETLRQQFIRTDFQYFERCRVHFERGNWPLFDKESPPADGQQPTLRSRLILLYTAYLGALSKFTLNSKGKRDRVNQRLQYAKAKNGNLVHALAQHYLNSGRVVSLWKEIFSVRQSFVNCYNYVQPLLQVAYWNDKEHDPSAVALSDKRFNELRQLYIDTFETLCRLLVLALGFEAIIHHNSLEIATQKGAMSLDAFEQMKNGVKPTLIAKYPIEDLFLLSLDPDFRNGIGHHSAHYDADADAIVLYATKGAKIISRIVGYTDFCQKLLALFAAFELAALYHHNVHILVDGRFI